MTDLTNMSPDDIAFLKKIGQVSDEEVKPKSTAKKDEE